MRPDSFVARLRTLLIIALCVLSAGLLAYLVTTPSSQSQPQAFVSPFPTPRPQSTPVEPYAQLDPAIIAYLQYGQPDYRVIPFEVLGADVPPVGAYLPLTGNTRFDLISPTPISPTPPPTTTLIPVFQPTSTPIPTRTPYTPPPTLTPDPSLVPTPTSELVVTVLAFVVTVSPESPPDRNTECAPGGLPVSGRLTQRFVGVHSGIDISAAPNTPVRTTQSGIVDWAGWSLYGYGNLVIIRSGRFITYYAHNNTLNVRKGDFVLRGTIVAFSGSTGFSSGPHVHYETRIDDVPVDPLTFEARDFTVC